ncbi:hypothetical protein [Candidatus Laterigemmans baculatus]|uniref:hypothetical protein n=1 Tax=Candidatus Laterigemmans baculatus TaxID=2770505 RepID=UPI0013DA8923|nr:hypothetical protein [Candidatus Laterigemmans baculatus]
MESELIDRPNIVLLTVGHTGSTVLSKMLGTLGWNLADADDEYGESVSVRNCNIAKAWGKIPSVLAALPEPWVIKDPRFCEHLERWMPGLERYSPTLVWLTRDSNDTRDSHTRRGESESLLNRRLMAAKRHFELWTGQKLRLDYDQVKAAASLFRPNPSIAAAISPSRHPAGLIVRRARSGTGTDDRAAFPDRQREVP